MVMLALVVVGVPMVLVVAVVFGVHAVRWARRNRARAAAMMTGTFLDDVTGGPIDTNDDSTIQHFVDWLSGKIDHVSEPARADAHHHGDHSTTDLSAGDQGHADGMTSGD